MNSEITKNEPTGSEDDNRTKRVALGTGRFLVFTLGTETFAIPLLTVREVIAVPEFTKVPNSPDYFLGIANLRGQIISAIDLRKKLKITTGEHAEPAVILCDVGSIQVGILVDSVNQVLAPAPAEVVAPPQVGSFIDPELICGVFRRKDELVFFLDLAKVLDGSGQDSLRAKRAG